MFSLSSFSVRAKKQGAHRACDLLWKHPSSGGCFWVGNQSASESLSLLDYRNITAIVNCTGGRRPLPNCHERQGIAYFRFDINSVYRRRILILAYIRVLLEKLKIIDMRDARAFSENKNRIINESVVL